MRARIILLLLSLLFAVPASAQTPASPQWEVAVKAHVLRREDSSRTSGGGGFSLARWFGPMPGLAVVVDATGTRRAGHNDWHLLAGGRFGGGTGRRVGWFVQGLAGTFFRQGHAGWAVQPGVGVDIRWATGRLVRLSVAAPVDSRHGNTQTGVLAGLGLVWR